MTIKELIATSIKVFIFILLFNSCKKSNIILKDSITSQRKCDSLLQLNISLSKNVFLKFGDILENEKKSLNDSILINDYKALLGKNKNLDIYIWNRIKIIYKNSNNNKIIKKFIGTYKLKTNKKYKTELINRVKITKDSIYLFQNADLVTVKESNFLFTSDKYTEGKIIIDRYFVKLNSAFGKIIFISDNLCMDCEELQFYKI